MWDPTFAADAADRAQEDYERRAAMECADDCIHCPWLEECGYEHLPDLDVDAMYEDGTVERIMQEVE